MQKAVNGYDLSEAVGYHYDQFPPKITYSGDLVRSLTRATSSLARYDQMLKGMHNSEVLLAPLRSQEAVFSSRMEGTISTLDEVLQFEADQEDEDGDDKAKNYRSEALEVALYGRAMRMAQASVKDGAPISPWLIRSTHRVLLGFGRGASMTPGEFKIEQNYLADRLRRKVSFIPISPERLLDGMGRLMEFIESDEYDILIKAALMHLEFEALHPFKDGNGRIGRMLITLLLWKGGAISQPHFYMSGYLEHRRDEYVDRMREVSRVGTWNDWVVFFLNALEAQAQGNLKKAEQISSLYEEMKDRFREVLASQWSTSVLDFLFTRPVFRNNVFTAKSGIPAPTAFRFVRALVDRDLLRTVVPSAGRRPAMYSFEPLLALVRE